MLSSIVVVAAGVMLLGMAILSVAKPLLAARFLRSFASSARAHYTEQLSRLVVGTAVLVCAPSTWYPLLFKGFGWLLILTTVGLLLVPWRWHQKFAGWAVPWAIRHLGLYALGAAALGTAILIGVSRMLVA